jgi:hypothetical protein
MTVFRAGMGFGKLMVGQNALSRAEARRRSENAKSIESNFLQFAFPLRLSASARDNELDRTWIKKAGPL